MFDRLVKIDTESRTGRITFCAFFRFPLQKKKKIQEEQISVGALILFFGNSHTVYFNNGLGVFSA